MHSERSGKSHAIAWTLAIMAVPVLYLLSVAPIQILTASKRDSQGYLPRLWAMEYGEPYEWLCDTAPFLRRTLTKYHNLWFNLTK